MKTTERIEGITVSVEMSISYKSGYDKKTVAECKKSITGAIALEEMEEFVRDVGRNGYESTIEQLKRAIDYERAKEEGAEVSTTQKDECPF